MRLRELRQARKLTQQRLSEISGVAREIINRIETGKSSPEVGTLIRLAKALECTLDDLVDMDEAV